MKNIMIKEKNLSQKKYYLISILIVFTIIMMLLFHIKSYYWGIFVFIIIFLFWLIYPKSLFRFLFLTLFSGGVIEILISRKYLGYIFIILALMFFLGRRVLVEE